MVCLIAYSLPTAKSMVDQIVVGGECCIEPVFVNGGRISCWALESFDTQCAPDWVHGLDTRWYD